MLENQQYDKKSLRFLKGNNTDWDELAKDAVCFANASGGKILIGLKMTKTSQQQIKLLQTKHFLKNYKSN